MTPRRREARRRDDRRRRAADLRDQDRPRSTGPRDERTTAILAVVARIPHGKITTYGSVAARAGLVRQARLVGKVLAALPAGSRVPWHRVVAAGGRIAFPVGSDARSRQIAKLAREGVEAGRGGRVDIERHGWSAGGERDLDRWLWGRVDE
jgi:methylated-DNA-protein-cysteine methyltransferase-like protein